jgi:hypothetical protein
LLGWYPISLNRKKRNAREMMGFVSGTNVDERYPLRSGRSIRDSECM